MLDRAFTIELSDTDFSAYPPESSVAGDLSDAERVELLKQFRSDGWPVIDKGMVREIVDEEPWVRDQLGTLNALLGDDGLQFAYRVFDEIACFVWRAARNGMWDGLEAAFDEAVLMKVLPKFHGSRARLEEPLRRVLAWCVNPDEPDLEQVSGPLYPRTHARAARLLRDLERVGFAAF